jgi:hypothetical protein
LAIVDPAGSPSLPGRLLGVYEVVASSQAAGAAGVAGLDGADGVGAAVAPGTGV